MYDRTARSQKNPSSHHVTISGQQFYVGSAVQEQSDKRHSRKSIVVRIRSMLNQLSWCSSTSSSTEKHKHAVVKWYKRITSAFKEYQGQA